MNVVDEIVKELQKYGYPITIGDYERWQSKLKINVCDAYQQGRDDENCKLTGEMVESFNSKEEYFKTLCK
jgi:hypothetical protein